MNEIIYLEPDEDITGVISRVKSAESKAVCLVVPRGGSISQSVVNLKLLKREIEKLGKAVSLVTKDKISKNLASQVGITVYTSASEAKNARIPIPLNNVAGGSDDSGKSSNAGFRINQYSREEDQEENDPEPQEEEELSDEQPPEILESDESEEDNINEELERERSSMASAEPKKINSLPQVREMENDEKIQKTSMPPKKKNLSSRRKPIIIISLVFVVILLVASVVWFPSAVAKVTLDTFDKEYSSEFTLDKSIEDVQLDSAKIPATGYSATKELEKDFNASGQKNIGTKAEGQISFYNDYDPQNSISLASGTALIADGKTYHLKSAVTIPSATVVSLFPTKINPGVTTGEIIASESGESYNIEANTFVISSFTGAKRENVYGRSSSALTGGTTKVVSVITSEDIENAKQSLITELDTQVKEELTNIAQADGNKLIMSSINESVISYSTDKNAEDEADTFKAKLKYSIDELSFNEKSFLDSVLEKSKQLLADDEMYVNPDYQQITYEIKSVDNENGSAVLAFVFDGKVGKKIDISKISKMLLRTKYGSAESRIESLDGVKSAEVTITPNFWPLLPIIEQRITVEFQYHQS